MKFQKLFLLLFVILIHSIDMDAQRHVRYQRRKARVDNRIQQDTRDGKISNQEQAEIDEREKKLNRTNRKAFRNGHVSGREQNKMNRRLRKVKREAKDAGRE